MGQVATHFKDAGTLRLLPLGGACSGRSRAVSSSTELSSKLRQCTVIPLRDLWRATGAEFKFVRSSFAKSDMGFFEGFPPNGPLSSETVTGRVTRQVVQVPVPGSSITGDTNFRVTATSTPSGSSQDATGAASISHEVFNFRPRKEHLFSNPGFCVLAALCDRWG